MSAAGPGYESPERDVDKVLNPVPANIPGSGVSGVLQGGAAAVPTSKSEGEQSLASFKGFLINWIENAKNIKSGFFEFNDSDYDCVIKSCIVLMEDLDQNGFAKVKTVCEEFLRKYSRNSDRRAKVQELSNGLDRFSKVQCPQRTDLYCMKSVRQNFEAIFKYKNVKGKIEAVLYEQIKKIYLEYISLDNFRKVFTPAQCVDLYNALIKLYNNCNAYLNEIGLFPIIIDIRAQVSFMLNNIENAFRGRLVQRDGRLIANFCSGKGYISLMDLLGNGEDISDKDHFEGDYVKPWCGFYETELKIFKEDLFDEIIKSFSNINAEDTFDGLFGEEGNAFRLFIVSMADRLHRLERLQGLETFSAHYDVELKHVQGVVKRTCRINRSVEEWYKFFKSNRKTLFWSVGPAAFLMIEKIMKLMMLYNGDIAKYNDKQWSTAKAETESVDFREDGDTAVELGDGWEKLTYVVKKEDDDDSEPEDTRSLAKVLVEKSRQEREERERLKQALKTSSSSSSSEASEGSHSSKSSSSTASRSAHSEVSGDGDSEGIPSIEEKEDDDDDDLSDADHPSELPPGITKALRPSERKKKQ